MGRSFSCAVALQRMCCRRSMAKTREGRKRVPKY
jgi:hypothetical protein